MSDKFEIRLTGGGLVKGNRTETNSWLVTVVDGKGKRSKRLTNRQLGAFLEMLKMGTTFIDRVLERDKDENKR